MPRLPSLPDYLQPYTAVNNLKGLCMPLKDWVLIIVSVWLSELAFASLPLPLAIVVYMAACFVIGFRQYGLYTVSHDAGHGTVFSSPWANWLVGTFPSGYLMCRSWTGELYAHIKVHHYEFLTPGDQTWSYFDEIGLPDSNRASVDAGTATVAERRLIVWVLNPFDGFMYVFRQFKNSFTFKHEDGLEKLIRAVYWVVIVAVCWRWDHCYMFLAYWMVPWIVVESKLDMLIDDVVDHYGIVTDANDPIRGQSRNREGWGLGVHNTNYHIVHHLFPKIPYYNAKAVHYLLLKHDPAYRAQPFYNGWDAVWRSIFHAKYDQPKSICTVDDTTTTS